MAADNIPLLRRRQVLVAKTETTTGTDITPGASDGVFVVYDPKYEPDIPMIGRPALSSFESLTSVPGPRSAKVSFDVDYSGLGGSGVPAWASVFLPACGMGAATSQVYTFNSSSASTVSTITIVLYENTRRRVITGCMGDFTINLKNGEPGRVHFEFVGVIGADTDAAAPTPTYPTVKPPRWANASAITFGSYSPLVSTAEIKAGNNVILRPDASKTAGWRSAMITSREAGGTFDPEATLVADRDWFSIHTTPTEEALAIVTGVTANNIMTIAAPKAQIIARPGGDRDGVITEGGLQLQFNRNASTLDSQFSLTFS